MTTMRGRVLRWGLFVLVAAGYLLIAVSGGDGPAWVAAMSVIYLGFPVMATISAMSAARAAGSDDRGFWRLLAVGMALMAAGEGWWAAWQVFVDPAGPSGFGIADLLFLPAYVMQIAAIVSLLWNRFAALTNFGRLKHTIDGLMLVTLAVVLATMLAPALASGAGSPPGYYTIYALLDLAILVGLVLSVLIVKRPIRQRWETIVAGGMALFAAADLIFNQLSSPGSYVMGGPGSALLDIVWMAGYFLIAAGAVHHRECAPMPASALSRSMAQGMEASPLLVAATAIPLFMYAARFRAISDTSYWIWVTAATWLGMLAASRVAVIAADNRELASHSIIDPLTGVTNHRYFHERLRLELDRARRTAEPLTLAHFDLDQLRMVNDTRGHLAGDRRIRLVASSIIEAVRTTDTVSRIGGDEFAVILPGTGSLDAYAVVDRILAEIVASQAGQDVRTTASVGLASFPEHAVVKEELTAGAEEALHRAKDGGRNQVVIYEPGVAGGRTTEARIRAVEAESLLRTVRALAAAVDARDAYTHSHSRSVAALAVALARRLEFSPNHVDQLKIAALLHDIGKIGTPDHVLRKPGPLDDEEYRIVKGHSELGERILSSVVSPELLPWVACHHERWDGGGYPRGISGEKIPLEARIIAVCDTYDAMTSDRPYRSGLPVEEAIREIETFAGRQFDPRIATVFVTMMREVSVAG
jgi:diguanylate cyclase (GGDEF)-like protein/putative nucleotidyltransferase with HDIG domain